MNTLSWLYANAVYLATIILVAIAADYGIGHVLRRITERRLRLRAHGKLVLTYDDGPYSISNLEELLHLLSDFDAKATFFLLGWRADDQPNKCELIQSAGHIIGSHTQKHTSAWKSPFFFVIDMLRGAHAVEKYSREQRWFRPPFGKMNMLGWLFAWASSLRPIFWTVDARDAYFQHDSKCKSIEKVLDEVRQLGGAVVLLHDHHSEAKPENSQRTLELTRKLLELAQKERLEVVTVEALYQ